MSEVHIWDCGMLCRFFYAPGGAGWAGDRLAKAVLSACAERDADHVLLCHDTIGIPTWRKELTKSYKGTRPKRSDDEMKALGEQHENLIVALNWATSLYAPGWEADDIVATAARASIEAGFDCSVFSADKDMGVLLADPDVHLFDGSLKREITEADIMSKFGVPPMQLSLYLALAGDSCDGIPGVPGIGPKAAQEILCKYHTADLERIIDHLSTIDLKRMTTPERKLWTHRDEARVCMKLTTLDYHTPLEVEWPWLKEPR